MKAGIFVASYGKDFPYLKGLLKSIKRFCHGFHRVTVAVPAYDRMRLLELIKMWHVADITNLRVACQQDTIPDGFMRAQYAMMSMDKYLWDCDQLCMVGSDCVFHADVSPEQYMLDDKPMMLIESLASLRSKGNPTTLWEPGTIEATGIRPKYDFMRMLPLTYTPKMQRVVREEVSKHLKMPLEKYLSLKRHKYFSESNVMGTVIYEKMNDSMVWYDSKPLPNPMNLLQFWSWGGMHDHRMDRWQPYNNRDNVTKNTKGMTAHEVTVDILGDLY